MTFIQKVSAVLNNETKIESLDVDDIVVCEKEEDSDLVRGKLSPLDKMQIFRLQTLIMSEFYRGYTDDASVESNEKSRLPALVMEDSEVRIIMLNQLINEIVREAIPRESEYFEVVYYLCSDGNLYRTKAYEENVL